MVVGSPLFSYLICVAPFWAPQPPSRNKETITTDAIVVRLYKTCSFPDIVKLLYRPVSSAVNGHSLSFLIHTLPITHGAIPSQSPHLRPTDDRGPSGDALSGLVARENPANPRHAPARCRHPGSFAPDASARGL